MAVLLIPQPGSAGDPTLTVDQDGNYVISADLSVLGDLVVSGNFTFDGDAFAFPLPLTLGGTGAASAAAARTSLGVEIGTDVQAWSAVLDATTASFLIADETKLDGIEALADVTDATNVAAAGAVMEADTTTAAMGFVIDEDNMASDLATKVPTQQSVKAYADTKQPLNANLTTLAGIVPGTAGQAILADAAVADVRTYISAAPYVADRTAMLALDTTKDTRALFDGSEWKWDGSDLSATLLGADITSTAVDAGTDTITKVAHGLRTGDAGVFTTAVNGVSLNTLYYVIRVDADNFKPASSLANAVAGTAFNLTGTTNFTFKEHIDPDQNIYVTPTATISGAAGAWVRTEAVTNGTGWSDSATPTNIRRMGDHILLGKGAVGWNGRIKATGGRGSWLFEEGDGITQMHYLLVNAMLSAVHDNADGLDSPYGIFAGVRTPGGASDAGVIGLTGYAKGNATSGASTAWGLYLDAVKGPSSNTSTQGAEIEITNLNSTPAAYNTPYSTFSQGRTMGLQIGSGAGGTFASPSDAETAIHIFNNGARFRNGIILRETSLTADAVTSYQHAVVMARKMRLEWYFGSTEGNIGLAIHGDISDLTHAQRWIMDDTGFAIFNTSGKKWLDIAYAANIVNGLRITPSATTVSPIIAPIGDDTNLGLDIDLKGTGGGRLRGGDGLAKVRWSSTGVAFLGAAPVGQQTMAAASGTAKRTTFATGSVTLPELAGVVMALIDDSRARGFHA